MTPISTALSAKELAGTFPASTSANGRARECSRRAAEVDPGMVVGERGSVHRLIAGQLQRRGRRKFSCSTGHTASGALHRRDLASIAPLPSTAPCASRTTLAGPGIGPLWTVVEVASRPGASRGGSPSKGFIFSQVGAAPMKGPACRYRSCAARRQCTTIQNLRVHGWGGSAAWSPASAGSP